MDNLKQQQLICLVEEDSDLRDKILSALHAEGYERCGFRTLTEALNHFQSTQLPPSLLLANDNQSSLEWFVFRSEFNERSDFKQTKLHTFKSDVPVKDLLQTIYLLLKR